MNTVYVIVIQSRPFQKPAVFWESFLGLYAANRRADEIRSTGEYDAIVLRTTVNETSVQTKLVIDGAPTP